MNRKTSPNSERRMTRKNSGVLIWIDAGRRKESTTDTCLLSLICPVLFLFWWTVPFLFLILILIACVSNQRSKVGWSPEGRLAGFGLGWKLPVPSVVCLSSGNCFLLPWPHAHCTWGIYFSSLGYTFSHWTHRGRGTAYQQDLLFGKPGVFVNILIPLFSLRRSKVCCRSSRSVISFRLLTVDLSFS